MISNNKVYDAEFLFKDWLVNAYTGMNGFMQLKKFSKNKKDLEIINNNINKTQKEFYKKFDVIYNKICNGECKQGPIVNKITLGILNYFRDIHLYEENNFKEFSKAFESINERISEDSLTFQNHKFYQQQQKPQNYQDFVVKKD